MGMEQLSALVTSSGSPEEENGLCLLSLDGGGVRGLSTLIILKDLMAQINQKRRTRGLPSVKPCQIFDLIGGTSTGGLIAIMLGRLGMDVEECISMYKAMFSRIFKTKKWSPLTLKGDIKPKFDSKILEEAIRDVMNQTDSMSHEAPDGQASSAIADELFNNGEVSSCRTFVCAASHEDDGFIVRLRSYPGREIEDTKATICQAALATSAASSFFDPVQIGKRTFVDGALGANNPVNEVWSEAQDIWCPRDGALEPLLKCIISIGTGHPGTKPIEDNAWKFFSSTLVRIATQTNSTASTFIEHKRGLLNRKQYIRLNVDQGLQDVGLEEYEKEDVIETATIKYLGQMERRFLVEDLAESLGRKQYHATSILQHNVDKGEQGIVYFNAGPNTRHLHTGGHVVRVHSPSCPVVFQMANVNRATGLHNMSLHGPLEALDVMDLKSFLQSISAWKLYDGGASISLEHPGTCRWILDEKTYKSWSEDIASGLIFIMGPSGCGKSILSKFLARHIRKTTEAHVMTFYCRGVASQGDTSSIMESLVYQLLDHDSLLYRHVPAKYRGLGNMQQKGPLVSPGSLQLHSLWEIFRALMEHTTETFYIFVDGLNEVDSRSRREFLALLNQNFNSAIGQETGIGGFVKLCITCTPSGDVIETAQRHIYLHDRTGESHSTADCLDEDIKRFVQFELSQIASERHHTTQMRAYAEEVILSGSQGSFLWVSCVLDELRDSDNTPEGLERALHSFPPTISEHYSRILQELYEADDNDIARNIFSTVLLAPRPLRHEELADAMSMRPGCTSLAEMRQYRNSDIVGYVYAKCPKLIRTNGSTFELVHYSLYEYCFRNHDLLTGHLQMTKTCITYLLLQDFKMPLQYENMDAYRRECSFHEYAATYWPYHLRNCGDKFVMEIKFLSQFLGDQESPHYQAWCQMMPWTTPYHVSNKVSLLHVFSYYGCLNAAQNLVILGLPFTGDSFWNRLVKVLKFEKRLFNAAFEIEPSLDLVVNINESMTMGKSALTCACQTRQLELVYLLLNYGASPNGGAYSDLITPLQAAVLKGYSEIVELLLMVGADVELTVSGEPNRTPLQWACVAGNTKIVEQLLTAKADINSGGGGHDTPLLIAVFNGREEVVDFLLQKGANVSLRNSQGYAPLTLAIERGSLRMVRSLLQHGADLYLLDNEGGNALLYAASYGRNDIVIEFLERGIDVLKPGTNGHIPLHIAAWRGHNEIIHTLLSFHADPNQRNPQGSCPIHIAAHNNHPKVVEQLIDHGADINARAQPGGETALFISASAGYEEAISLLIRKGADLEIKSENGMTPLTVAAQQGHKDAVARLLAAQEVGEDVIRYSLPLSNASAAGHVDVVRLLLQHGYEVDKGGVVMTPLSVAALNGHKAVVELLLKHGANIESKELPAGHTPLFHAARWGRVEATRALLSVGAKKDVVAADGLTPFHIAAQYGFNEVLDLLLQEESSEDGSKDPALGATLTEDDSEAVEYAKQSRGKTSPLREILEMKTMNGDTALSLACRSGHVDTVKLLIAAGADTNVRADRSWTLLHLAVSVKNHQLARLFLSENSSLLDDSANNVESPLVLACARGDFEGAQILLDAGANPCSNFSPAATALHQAAMIGNTSTINLLLRYGAVVDDRNGDGATALHLAFRLRHEEAVLRLLAAGASVEPDPWTMSPPLHQAAYWGRTNIVELLLDDGIPVDTIDELGRTALTWAIAGQHPAIIELLIRRGAEFQKLDCFGRSAYGYILSRYVFNDESLQVIWEEHLSKQSTPAQIVRYISRLQSIAQAAVNIARLTGSGNIKHYMFLDLGFCMHYLSNNDLVSPAFRTYTKEQKTKLFMREITCKSCKELLNTHEFFFLCTRSIDVNLCNKCWSNNLDKPSGDLRAPFKVCKQHPFIKVIKHVGEAEFDSNLPEVRQWLQDVETYALEVLQTTLPLLMSNWLRDRVTRITSKTTKISVRRLWRFSSMLLTHPLHTPAKAFAQVRYRCVFWRVMASSPCIRTPSGWRTYPARKSERLTRRFVLACRARFELWEKRRLWGPGVYDLYYKYL